MSSDSEDDCYGNMAMKLQSIKSKYKEDLLVTTNFLDDSFKTDPKPKKVANVVEIANNCGKNDSVVVNNDSDCEEISLDTIIAQNSKKRLNRNLKRNADISADNILPTRRRKAMASKKTCENVAVTTGSNPNSSNQRVNVDTPLPPVVPNSVNTRRGRGRGRRRGRGSVSTSNTVNPTNTGPNHTNSTANPTNTAPNPTNTSVNATNVTVNSANVTVNATNVSVNATNVTINATAATVIPTATTVTPTATTATPTNTTINNPVHAPGTSTADIGSIFDSILFNTSRSRRGRRGQTTRTRRGRRMWLPDFFSRFNFGASDSRQIQSAVSSSTNSSYPTYSVGNTSEYPDECYNQPLFTNQTKTDDVIVLGDNDSENYAIDENEELSVKVYWQNREHVKFTIRRFQKLTQIFNFFAERENVSHDKLLFTYNDKILKIDDTPDSITYSFVKFIDGGIINQSVSKIVQNDRNIIKNGIKLKFQCQNVKKPFETTIRLDDKLAVAMMMCAEHLEKPLDKLKFNFDGDLITGKSTPRELELEGGECIDVKIAS